MNKKVISFIAIVVLLVVAAAVFAFIQEKNAVDTARKDAPKGELSPDFPSQLILKADDSQIESSYNQKTELGDIQRTSVFVGTKNLNDTYQEYLSSLSSEGYRILNKDIAVKSANIFASKPGVADVNIVITEQAGGKIQMSVTYLEKKEMTK